MNWELVLTYIPLVVSILITFAIASILALITRKYFGRLIKEHIIKQYPERETAFRLIQRCVVIGIYLAAAAISASLIFPGLGAYAVSLLIGAGFLGIVIGMAASRVIGNIISGFNVILTRPIRVGDAVMLRGEFGFIEDITLRHTVIRTWDNRRMMIPNAVLDDEVIINYSIKDPKKLAPIVVSVPYDTDLEKVAKIMVEEAKKHPDVLPELEPIFQVLDFGEGAITLRLLFLAKDQPTAFNTACALRRTIKKRFDEEGIRISCPVRYVIPAEKPE
ncbi:mechanosensitive ion channel [Candidatus Bathyarchaeota archaeon]|nr:mechanosensitive ion channel [Candidatus Bathyarchaeota archaeon]